MPRPRSDSREKIIEAARFLLSRRGYRGTGMAQIIEHSGAPRGSVYFLFPGGKEQVAVAAVRTLEVNLTEFIRQKTTASATVQEWIGTLADHFAGALEESDFAEGLPVTSVTLDSVPDSTELTAACRSAYDSWLGALAEALAGYGVARSRCDDIAGLILITLEGAAILCRAYQSTEPLRRVVPYIISLCTED